MDAGFALVTGATDALARALSDGQGPDGGTVDLDAQPGRRYRVTVRLLPPPASPAERRKLAAEIQLDAMARAPDRLCGVIAGAPETTAAVVRYLLGAEAVTGQLLCAEA